MCGRFLIDESAFEQASKIAVIPEWIQEELKFGNIFPSQNALVLADAGGHLQGELMPFGFYSQSMKKRIINSRAETASQKWMFRHALKTSRCAAVCSLFYEWDAQKQMISFFEKDREAMYLAGIVIENQLILLTVAANPSVSPYHHRMPLVLNAGQAKEWILSSQETEAFLHYQPQPLACSQDFIQHTLF